MGYFSLRFVAIFALALFAAGCSAQTIPTAYSAGQPLAVADSGGKLTTSPSKLNFTTNPKLKLVVSESGYTGAFSLALSEKGIVKYSPAKVKGPKVTLNVSAVAAGKTTLVVSDDHGGSKSVPITVTQGVIIIQ